MIAVSYTHLDVYKRQPVFASDGSVLGAISVSSLYKPEENYTVLGQAVAKKAAEVSKLLGFLGKI